MANYYAVVYPRPTGGSRGSYSYTVSLTTVLDGVGGQRHALAA